MYATKPFECDLMIIGSGMAGMAAAVYASNRGINTAQVGVTGEILYSTGYIDILGVHPIESKKQWDNPWEALSRLQNDLQNHPYARLPIEDIKKAVFEFLDYFNDSALPFYYEKNHNLTMLTPIGTTKKTFAVPCSMAQGAKGLAEKSPCLILDFEGLKGFSAKQIAETVSGQWPGIRTARIQFPDIPKGQDLYPEKAALSIEVDKIRHRFIERVMPLIGDAQYLGIPALAGMFNTKTVIEDLERQLGVKVFEIPTMPPGVPGIRLKEILENKLASAGVKQYLQKRVKLIRHEEDGSFRLGIGDTGTEHTVKAKTVLLSTGRFIGQGLHASRKGIQEKLLDLPVKQAQKRSQWHRENMFDPRGNKINQAGLDVDSDFRPLEMDGSPAFDRLFASGSILSDQDWMRTKSGSGISLSTSWAAIHQIAKRLGETT
jgi:glycerol-3-phosphate dehydrogenase subunit B